MQQIPALFASAFAHLCVHTCLHLGLIIPLYGSERLPCGSSVALFIIRLSLHTEAEREGCDGL